MALVQYGHVPTSHRSASQPLKSRSGRGPDSEMADHDLYLDMSAYRTKDPLDKGSYLKGLDLGTMKSWPVGAARMVPKMLKQGGALDHAGRMIVPSNSMSVPRPLADALMKRMSAAAARLQNWIPQINPRVPRHSGMLARIDRLRREALQVHEEFKVTQACLRAIKNKRQADTYQADSPKLKSGATLRADAYSSDAGQKLKNSSLLSIDMGCSFTVLEPGHVSKTSLFRSAGALGEMDVRLWH